MVVETTGEYCSRLPIASRLGSVTSLNCRVLRADGLIKVVQGPASRLPQRQPLGPAFDLLVIDRLFFDGTSQKQGHVKHLVPPEFIHVRHTVLPVLSRLPPAIMVVLPGCTSRGTGYSILSLMSDHYLPCFTSRLTETRLVTESMTREDPGLTKVSPG